jgi:hypothetical protein
MNPHQNNMNPQGQGMNPNQNNMNPNQNNMNPNQNNMNPTQNNINQGMGQGTPQPNGNGLRMPMPNLTPMAAGGVPSGRNSGSSTGSGNNSGNRFMNGNTPNGGHSGHSHNTNSGNSNNSNLNTPNNSNRNSTLSMDSEFFPNVFGSGGGVGGRISPADNAPIGNGGANTYGSARMDFARNMNNVSNINNNNMNNNNANNNANRNMSNNGPNNAPSSSRVVMASGDDGASMFTFQSPSSPDESGEAPAPGNSGIPQRQLSHVSTQGNQSSQGFISSPQGVQNQEYPNQGSTSSGNLPPQGNDLAQGSPLSQGNNSNSLARQSTVPQASPPRAQNAGVTMTPTRVVHHNRGIGQVIGPPPDAANASSSGEGGSSTAVNNTNSTITNTITTTPTRVHHNRGTGQLIGPPPGVNNVQLLSPLSSDENGGTVNGNDNSGLGGNNAANNVLSMTESMSGGMSGSGMSGGIMSGAEKSVSYLDNDDEEGKLAHLLADGNLDQVIDGMQVERY